MKIISELYGNSFRGEELKAEILTDGYGSFVIKKYVQGEFLSETNYLKYELNTVKIIAENWVLNNINNQ